MMKKVTIGAAIILVIGLTGCTQQKTSISPAQAIDTLSNQTTNVMKNFVSIVEIPTADFSRAVAFYQAILGITIEEVNMDGIKMGLFPGDGKSVSVQLINGSDYKPSAGGTIVYLSSEDDLQQVVDKIVAQGGKILVPKTEISPEMGFYALFIDTEGNKVGLHSSN
jgi:uncharacterized protein